MLGIYYYISRPRILGEERYGRGEPSGKKDRRPYPPPQEVTGRNGIWQRTDIRVGDGTGAGPCI